MNGFLSFLAACLAGVAGLFASGWVASLHAGWHQMSNREGAAGYFVVLMALVGGVVAFVAGIIVARMVAHSAEPGFLKAAGGGLAFVAAATGLVLLLSRLTADIPPRLDGKVLVLEVEFRLPVGAERPTGESGAPHFELRSVINGVARDGEYGKLQIDRMREEGGRWIVPASVALFSRRGQRAVDAKFGETVIGRFLVPLPGKPGPEFLEWSEWMPRPRSGEPAWPDSEPSYRFRIQREP